jgi:hypothetical protein
MAKGMATKGMKLPQMMIQYKVKPGQVERNLELLHAFFDELATCQPKGLRYASFQLDDKVSFVHFVQTDDGAGPLPALKAFQRYRITIEERCDEPPVMTQLNEIATFHFG